MGPAEAHRLEVPGLDALRRLFAALDERGCDPEWTAGGRAIVATCPSCGGRRGLVVELAADQEKTPA